MTALKQMKQKIVMEIVKKQLLGMEPIAKRRTAEGIKCFIWKQALIQMILYAMVVDICKKVLKLTDSAYTTTVHARK